MGWLNYYGIAIIVIVLLPNLIFAVKHKYGFTNIYSNKIVEVFEQIGRYGCMCFMIFNVPFTYFNFWFANALIVYLSVNSLLCIAYLLCWIVLWKKNGKLRALLLSVLPSLIFIFSGMVLANIPLIAFAIVFAVFHILLSIKNAMCYTPN